MDQPLRFDTTADGSKTLFNSKVGEHYHSRHGALQESKHVFLEAGLKHALRPETTKIKVLEVGFGTGLNFLVSSDFCEGANLALEYTGIEAYPLTPELIGETGYHQYVSPDVWDGLMDGYEQALSQQIRPTPFTSLEIACVPLLSFTCSTIYDVIYFDAFAAIHQPEMWSDESLAHVTEFLAPGGIFVTYAITGNLKRSMKQLGFSIEKVPGAPGKREMLRAVKL